MEETGTKDAPAYHYGVIARAIEQIAAAAPRSRRSRRSPPAWG